MGRPDRPLRGRGPVPGLGLALLLGLGACAASHDEPAGEVASPAAGGVPMLVDLEGNRVPLPTEPRADERHTLLLFVGVRCPISNAFSPELRRIHGEYADRPLDTYLVYTDADESAQDLERHVAEYELRGEVLLDFEQVLASRLGIRVTPEAALLSPDGELVYRGRIDDRYVDFGKQRAAPGRRDLRDALEAVFAGRAPEVARTEAVGCFLPDLPGDRGGSGG